jgi:hypothetical protein
MQTARSLASATCRRDIRRPTGSDPVAAASPHDRGRTASSTSHLLSFSTGSPISSRHRGSTGIGITECSRRIIGSGKPSRRSRSGTSASHARPRPVGMRLAVTPRGAALTRIKNPARTTRRGSRGPNSLPGWARSFRWSARGVVATSGCLLCVAESRSPNSPPAPASPSVPSLHRLPPSNTRPPGQPKGTDRRPIAGVTRSCRPQ